MNAGLDELEITGSARRGLARLSVTDNPSNELVTRLFIPVLLAAGIVYRYPSQFGSKHSLQTHGVYRFRLTGRFLIDGVSKMLTHIPGVGPHHSPLRLSWMIVNGTSFILACALASGLLLRNPDQNRPTLYFTVVAAMVMASTTITPYDFLSIALFIIVFWIATTRQPSLLVLVPLAVLSMATQETAFIAVAAVAVVRSPSGAIRDVLSTIARDNIVRGLAAISVATYAILHIALHEPSGPKATLFEVIALRDNVGVGNLVVLALALMILVSLRLACRSTPNIGQNIRRRTFWVLCIPYLAVCIVGGLWNEAPRLLLPVFIGELLCEVSSSRKPAAIAQVSRQCG